MPNIVFDEAFGQGADLCAAIVGLALPNRPLIETLLVDSIDESGIETLSGIVDRQGEAVDFMPTAPRGGVPQPTKLANGDGLKVDCVHIPTNMTIYTDYAQSLRAFGQSTLTLPETVRARRWGQ